MKSDERLWLVAFLAGLSAISLVVWAQMYRLSPVLFTSQIFFQLILAATLIAMLRNVVGIKAFGVFGPTIVTFALLKAGPVWGLVLFFDVFLVALGTRFVLEPLRLGANHRVAVVITTVALSLTLLEVLGEVVHLQIIEASLLLPVLITSWLADEFADNVKEMDWVEPVKKLGGTVALILASYALMTTQPLVDFFIRTPPLWVAAIGLNIWAARNVRFRLSERLRFRPAASGEGGLDGVLSMNERNRGVIAEFNPPWAFAGVEKVEMKRALHGLEIPTPRTVMVVEERVQPAGFFDRFYYRGVPDIRVIVLRGFPLMAMTRLPTKESGGAANLHKGAVGVGLSIATGEPVRAFWTTGGGTIDKHPDTGRPFAELKVPDWQAILEVAVRAQAASRLGYAGVDIVVDRTHGPLVLEVNKRPGLAVQNANAEGVGRRIDFVKARLKEAEFEPIARRVELARGWDKAGWVKA